MTSALVYKELRETIGIALGGLIVLAGLALAEMGWNPLLGIQAARGSEIPFISDGFVFEFGVVAGALAAALGMRQSLGDFWGEAHQFLLTRPVNRKTLYRIKLAVGLAIYLVCGALPIAIYGWWAATPGTHASPFEWSMTNSSWTCWLAMTAVYLGALLSGVRPAAWFGTRLAPLSATIFAAVAAIVVGGWPGLIILVAADAVLILSIRFVTNTRDFN
jgi:hypothetical protein